MEDDLNKLVPEGIEGIVPYKGNVSDTIYQILSGLQSGNGLLVEQKIFMKWKLKHNLSE